MKIKQPEMRVTSLAPAAAPAMASNALQVEDEFNAFYMAGTDGAAGHVLRPPYDPRVLERLTQENNVLGACIDAMVVNVAGTGHRIERETKRADEPDEQDDPVAQKLEAFFREPFPGTSFLAMRRDLERDMERVGYGALEIMRNPAGEVVFLRNTPARTIRLCKLDAPAPVAKTVSRNGAEISVNVMVRERRFVQLMAGQLLFFKEFGASRQLDKHTGQWESADRPVPVQARATELLYFQVGQDPNSPYGVPRWEGQIPSVVGSRAAEENNLTYLQSGGLPPALIVVQGGIVAGEARQALERQFAPGQKSRAAILEVPATDGMLDKPGTVKVVSSTLSSVTVDQPYAVLAAFSYTLHITMPDGTLQKRTLTNAAGETATFTWSTPLHEEPLAGAVWAITSTSLEARQFLLVSNIEVGPATFEAMGVFHDPAKFDRVEKGIVVPPPPYNVTPTGPIVPPTGPSSMMRLYQVGSAVRAAVLLSWAKSDDGRVYAYEVQVKGPQDIDYQTIGTTSMTSIEYQDSQEGTYDFRVRAKALNGKTSAWLEATNITLTTAIPPSNVTGLDDVYDPDGVSIRWNAVEDLNVDYYEVRRGPVSETTWNSATKVGALRELRYTEKGVGVGTYRYWVAAVSRPQGIYSLVPARVDVVVQAPPTPSVSLTLEADIYKIAWTGGVSSFQVEEYELRWGEIWASATFLSRVKGTTFTSPVRWGGSRTFWVAGVDKAGNYGAAGSSTLNVAAPTAVSGLTAQVIDNNVLLKWGNASSALPIDRYVVKKGGTWAGGILIGDKSGTFTSVFESAAGTYTYWVAAVDSGGNEGTPTAVTAVVNQPPDYLLRVEWPSSLLGHKVNLTLQGGVLYGPTNTGETWLTHFTNRGWDQPQDQIDAGYVDWLDPGPGAASYEESFDYGSVVDGTLVTINVSKTDVSGTVAMTTTLESSLDGLAWTLVGTGSQQYVSNFRHLRVRLGFASTGAVCAITAISVKLASKTKTDAGLVATGAGDGGGTTVWFNTPFTAVSSIQVSPVGTAARYAIYDFAGVPYPTNFKVLLFDAAGNRISGQVSWTARGY